MQQNNINFINSKVLTAGVDEAGRGALAGCVVAAYRQVSLCMKWA